MASRRGSAKRRSDAAASKRSGCDAESADDRAQRRAVADRGRALVFAVVDTIGHFLQQ